jgi:CHAD domain-containing protein
MAFVSNIEAAVAQIRANAQGAAVGRDAEYLHQLRVGIRRLRSTLRVFRALVTRRRAAQLGKELRATLRALGRARDWDVFQQSRFAPVLQRAAQAPRAAAQRSVRRVLGHERFRSLLKKTLAWARREPWRASANPGAPLGPFGARALRPLYRAVRNIVAHIEWSDPEQRHRVRVRLKRLRYGSDCFAAGFAPEALGGFQHRLRVMQHMLGELNDISVQYGLLRKLAHDKDLARAVARARSELAARERVLIGEIPKAWSKLVSHPPRWRRAVVVGSQ